jgi:hypothetical protein
LSGHDTFFGVVRGCWNQEGVFDGMRTLTVLNLANNRIAKIGLDVFTTNAGLDSLRHILLNKNLLTEVDPWPLVRGQLLPGCEVNLESNRIATFTNRLNLTFRCGSKPHVQGLFGLKYNPFGHLMDLVNGWNILGEGRTHFLSMML